MQAATELCGVMAKIYQKEDIRQLEFISTIKQLGITVGYRRAGSTGSNGKAPVYTDGDCHVRVDRTTVTYVLFEAKAELCADPVFQLLRYVQVRANACTYAPAVTVLREAVHRLLRSMVK
jgi:hypothetical protein